MRLIAGLGNPGRDYVGTRHNIGFAVIDALANRFAFASGKSAFETFAKNRFAGLMLDGNVSLPGGGTEKVLLLKPMTYMNLSGESIQQAMAFYNMTPADLMVVLDDIALPCGKLRLRGSGSSGGHNGLKDIERCLSTQQYPRMRIGVDAPPPRIPQKDYVLGRFTEAQQIQMYTVMDRACAAILLWIEKGLNPAMNLFNAEPDK